MKKYADVLFQKSLWPFLQIIQWIDYVVENINGKIICKKGQTNFKMTSLSIPLLKESKK